MDNLINDNSQFINKTYTKHLIPSIISLAIIQLGLMINDFLAGAFFGEVGLSAMAVAKPLFLLFSTLGSLLSVGYSILISNYIGSSNNKNINGVFSVLVISSIIFGLFFSILGLIFLEPLLYSFGATPAIFSVAKAYCSTFLFGSTFLVTLYIPLNFFRIKGKNVLIIILVSLMTIIDVSFALLFICVFKLGIESISLAMVLGYLFLSILGLLVLFVGENSFKFILKFKNFKSLFKAFSYGSPSAINNFTNIVRIVIMNFMILSLVSEEGLSAFSIMSTVNILSIAVAFGAAQAIVPFIGIFYSEQDTVSIKQIFINAFKKGIIISLAFSLIFIAFSDAYISLFSLNSQNAFSLAKSAVIWFSLSVPISFINYLIISFCQAKKMILISLVLTILRGFVFVVGFAFIFSNYFGIVGVWASFLAAEIFTFFVYCLYCFFISRKNKKMSSFLLINNSIQNEGKSQSFSVPSDQYKATAIVEKISEFCENNDLSPKTSMAITLSIEEISVILSENALKNNKDEFINIRILIYDGKITIRFRCGGEVCNPLLVKETSDDEFNFEEGIGITMLKKLTSSISYSRDLGVNNLTVII